MDLHFIMWIAFGVVIATVLALDLFVLHKKPHAVSLREAMIWSGVWIFIALIYGGVVAILPASDDPAVQGFGPVVAQRYLAAYVIELALSVDNLFVFAVIFAALGIKREHQHKLLFWGVIGALALRAGFILAGVELIQKFTWLMYIFGAILIFTGIKLLFQGDKEIDPKKSWVIRLASKIFPVKAEIGGPTFWVRVDGKRFATMLFIGLIMVEATDVVFAIDSIPAALAVAIDPETNIADSLVVYSSNAFAIMGLRSLYFALAGIMAAFRFLKYGLAIVLTFVGVKMSLLPGLGYPVIAEGYSFSLKNFDWLWNLAWVQVLEPIHVPIGLSLGVICGVLVATIVLSLAIKAKHEPKPPKEVQSQPESGGPEQDEDPAEDR